MKFSGLDKTLGDVFTRGKQTTAVYRLAGDARSIEIYPGDIAEVISVDRVGWATRNVSMILFP